MLKQALAVSEEQPRKKIGWKRPLLIGSGLLLAALVIAVWVLIAPFWGGLDLLRPALTPAAFETETGMQVTRVNVTFGGGMLDFRFHITDPGKANTLFQDADNIPILLAGNGLKLRPSTHDAYMDDLESGQSYYVFYGNANGTVKPGDTISVLVGNKRLKIDVAR